MLEDRAGAVHDPRDAARLVTPGNLEDDLGRWPTATGSSRRSSRSSTAKQALYARLEAVRRPGTIVSSNTSTIPLAELTEGLPESFAARLPDHPFLQSAALHAAAGGRRRAGDPARGAVEAISRFADARLGKGVVRARTRRASSPTASAPTGCRRRSTEAIELGLTVEEADAVLGAPVGIPKTGVFGLLDLVGIDLMPQRGRQHGRGCCRPATGCARNRREQPLIARMIAEGRTGRKGKGGFYRLRQASGRQGQGGDRPAAPATYRPSAQGRGSTASTPPRRAACARWSTHPDRGGRYAWAVLSETLAYAAELVPGDRRRRSTASMRRCASATTGSSGRSS